VGGALSSSAGASGAAAAQQAGLNAAAGVSDSNAALAERNAHYALLAGERAYQRSRLQTAQIKGRQRLALAANGVDLGSGSAAALQTTTDYIGEVDANTIEANAVREAWGHRVQATNFTNDAIMKRAGASGINPSAAGLGPLLGGAGTVAKEWYKSSTASGEEAPKRQKISASFWDDPGY
jgi:hypothetical protein